MQADSVLINSVRLRPAGGHLALMVAVLAAAPPVAWLACHGFGLTLPMNSPLQALWVLALAPVLEETAFRALLQRGIFETLKPRLVHAGHLANLITAFAFAASHLPAQGANALLWLIPAAVLGDVWRRSGRLWQCVLLHAWFNACLAWASS